MERKDCYTPIDRGCSITIPVTIQNVDTTPMDLTGYNVLFTVKKVPSDHDKDDNVAFIKKDFSPQNPEFGAFSIELNARETNLDTGTYFFDIVLISPEKDAWRAVQMNFEIVGGVSNRQVEYSSGVNVKGTPIKVVVVPKKPIIITTTKN